MVKILLYLIATFLETGLGIWIFAQAFPKRKRMECRHQVSEWVLVTTLVASTYSFIRYYYCMNEKKFLQIVIPSYMIILIMYVFRCMKCIGKNEKKQIMQIFFIWISILLTLQYWISYQSDIMMIMGNLFGVFFLFSFYQCELLQACLWQAIYIISIGMAKTICVVYMSALGGERFNEFLLYPRQHSYEEVIYWILIEIGLLLVIKYIPLKNLVKIIFDKHKKIILLILVFEYFIMQLLLNKGKGSATQRNLTISLLIFIIFSFIILSMLLRFLKKVDDAEKELFLIRNKAIECQYQELSEAYERYRHLVHDEKHILSYLKECLLIGNYTEALSFIENSQNSIIDKNRAFWTGITTLDFMLNIKKRKMDRLGIQFELNPGISEIPMEDSDFVVLLGNLLDNAIEAVEQCEPGNRKIWMGIQNANEMFLLRMKNTCVVMPNRKQGRFITSKSDTKEHGVGIESVKGIAEKYQGHAEFSYGQGYFEVTFLIT